jgi:DNA-binding winged helix-turn-helix (wHTH) protein
VTGLGAPVSRPTGHAELLRLAERLDLLDLDPRPNRPRLDRYGLLRFGGHVVPLSPREERVIDLLLAADGAALPVSWLASRAWEGCGAPEAAVRTCMTRLRRRLDPVGLTVRCVRGRGYVLDVRR